MFVEIVSNWVNKTIAPARAGGLIIKTNLNSGEKAPKNWFSRRWTILDGSQSVGRSQQQQEKKKTIQKKRERRSTQKIICVRISFSSRAAPPTPTDRRHNHCERRAKIFPYIKIRRSAAIINSNSLRIEQWKPHQWDTEKKNPFKRTQNLNTNDFVEFREISRSSDKKYFSEISNTEKKVKMSRR